jgi:hypothetical protein
MTTAATSVVRTACREPACDNGVIPAAIHAKRWEASSYQIMRMKLADGPEIT